MNDFYRTGMGHKFYEGTMPQLVKQLTRLNDNLEALLKIIEDDRKILNEREGKGQ